MWSMGVLLYALLCGYLPFDDENIGTLYRKIQDGKYEKPAWLSEGSLQMLDKVTTLIPMHRPVNFPVIELDKHIKLIHVAYRCSKLMQKNALPFVIYYRILG